MPDSVSRTALTTLLPPGSLWIPDGDFDLLLDGMGDNSEVVRTFLADLAFIRNAAKTPILSDLEKENGIFPDPTLSVDQRRTQLAATIAAGNGDGTDTFLQARLRESGFDVFVYQNDPPIDPDTLLVAGFKVFCDGDDAFCGNELALCGRGTGKLVVNGISDLDGTLSSPAASEDYPMVFFVGGAVTRDGVTNEILTIESAQVFTSRINELTRLIVKYKPLFTWAAVFVEGIANPDSPEEAPGG